MCDKTMRMGENFLASEVPIQGKRIEIAAEGRKCPRPSGTGQGIEANLRCEDMEKKGADERKV